MRNSPDFFLVGQTVKAFFSPIHDPILFLLFVFFSLMSAFRLYTQLLPLPPPFMESLCIPPSLFSFFRKGGLFEIFLFIAYVVGRGALGISVQPNPSFGPAPSLRCRTVCLFFLMNVYGVSGVNSLVRSFFPIALGCGFNLTLALARVVKGSSLFPSPSAFSLRILLFFCFY